MRPFLAVAALAALAGCFTAYEGTAADDGLGAPVQCEVAADCVLAGPSCCDCPSYATPASSGWLETCANVDCTPPTDGTCAPLTAECQAGTCVAVCAPTTCDTACPTGYAPDASGCLTCACAPTSAPAACLLDTDCVQVPADCCGCARGGADTAVPAAEADTHVMNLGCPANPGEVPCPEVTTCAADVGPRCILGQCVLGDSSLGPPPLPPGACGRADLPACPAGQACVINQDPAGNPLGVGVCTPVP